MDKDVDRKALAHDLRRRLLEGPVLVRAHELAFPLSEWRATVREVAQELGRPVTLYATADTTWARLVDQR